jgi:hypothetical protein
MKRIRRLLLVAALLSTALCVVLLLNFSPFTLTHHRYSSHPVLMSGNSSEIGSSAENILAADLNLPHNGSTGQRQCICNDGESGVPNGCTVCLVSLRLFASYRIPDFVSNNFIAEAKNRQDLLVGQSDQLQQITDYAAAATALRRPLWLFTRVDTIIDPPYQQLVEGTGGQIVRYFVPPGYTDPVDSLARSGLFVSMALTGVLVFVEVIEVRRRNGWHRVPTMTIPVNPDMPPRPPTHPVDRAVQGVDHAERFLHSAQDGVKDQLDMNE